MPAPNLESDHLGPYHLVSELGSGAMGRVFLATVTDESPTADLAVGTRVAVKVIHPELFARADFFARFLREGAIGKRIRHQNVVATFDACASALRGSTYLYLVMEYVEGRTLRQLLEDLGRVPDALLREIATQLAAGLVAVHAAGVVHRDLKPENALITAEHEVRLMDLGVARLADASAALTQAGAFAGTLDYGAPELFTGEAAGPSADLYSLGVTLYELATGSNPFSRGNAAAAIHAHREYTPPAPDGVHAGVSPFLAQVIVTLLAKRRENRFVSASELLETLELGERSGWWAKRESELSRDGLRPLVSVRRGAPLHGRDAELGVLRAAWNEAREGRGSTLFVEGEAGIGKTRLVDDFIRELGACDAHVLYGSYSPGGTIGGLAEAVVSALGSASLEETLHRYLPATPGLVPAFAAMMRRESLPDGSAPLNADAVHTLMCHLMKGLAAERTLLWVVDDLHFAGEASRNIVLSLGRAVTNAPALLLVTARPGLPSEELANLARAGRTHRLTLGRLSAADIAGIVRAVLKSARLTDKLAATLADKSDGVPLFVLGMLDELDKGGHLTRRADGGYEESTAIDAIHVPSAVRDLVHARLDELSDEDRAILDVAAVQGFRFEPDLVARVRSVKRVVLLERLAVLERKTGIVRGDGGVCRFDHHQVRELLYEELMPVLRSEYHTLLADALADREGADDGDPAATPGESAYFLASHRLAGSAPGQGLRHLVRALEHLSQSHRRDAALPLAQTALALEGLLEGDLRSDVLRRTAKLLDLAGRREEERLVLDEALALADASGEPGRMARARSQLGWHLLAVSKPAEASSRLQDALDLARRAQDRGEEASITGHLGSAALDLSRFDEARSHFECHLALARELGDRRGEATALGNLGIVAKLTAQYDEARAFYRQDLEITRALGDRSAEGISTANLGILHSERGDYEQARELYERALSLFRESGYRRGEVAAMGYLGAVARALGRYADALARHEEQSVLAREIGNPSTEAIALVNAAEIEREIGNPERAREALEKARAIFRSIGDQRSESYAIHALGVVAATQERGADAEAFLVQALEVRRSIGFPRGQMETQLALGRLLAVLDREDEARAALAEARTLAEALGASDGLLLAAARQALLGEGDRDEVVALFAAHAPRLRHAALMEARYLLWSLTAEPEHLTAAQALLDHLLAHAPAESRESLVADVPLHRAIRAG